MQVYKQSCHSQHQAQEINILTKEQLMIRWNKTLTMTISYQDKSSYDNKRKKLKEININVTNVAYNIDNPMEIVLPDGQSIIVDAEYMKTACDKALKIHAI